MEKQALRRYSVFAAVPPEPRFWQRHSPNHEFTLSSTASFFLHALLFSFLLFGGALLAGIIPRGQNRGPAIGVIALPNEDSKQPISGAADAAAKSELLPERERKPHYDAAAGARESLNEPRGPTEVDLAIPDRGNGKRFLEWSQHETRKLDQRARTATTIPGGPVGSTGPVGKAEIKRTIRQQRWTMLFNTKDGNDYARQLKVLGAILAIPEPSGQYRLIRDLGQRPAQGKIEDLSKIDRIYWVDDKPESVQSLSKALGISPPPKQVVAFFPEKLEKELLSKELAFAGRKEESIKSTQFAIKPIANGFEAKVVSQVPAR
jgi:hypothetical protein